MERFCSKCGSRLNGKGFCPKCRAEGAGAAQSGGKKGKKDKTLRIAVIAIAVLLLIFLAVFLLMHFGVINSLCAKGTVEQQNSGWEDWADDAPPKYVSETVIERPDAVTEMEAIGSVVSQTAFSDSRTMQTEAEAYRDLKERGFTQYPITTIYGANGKPIEEKEISERSDEVHPVYMTAYITGEGAVWSIVSVNGAITANPVSYNSGEYWETAHILSETGTSVQYDGISGTFYEIDPEPSEIRIKMVMRITAPLLETMTMEEVDR